LLDGRNSTAIRATLWGIVGERLGGGPGQGILNTQNGSGERTRDVRD